MPSTCGGAASTMSAHTGSAAASPAGTCTVPQAARPRASSAVRERAAARRGSTPRGYRCDPGSGIGQTGAMIAQPRPGLSEASILAAVLPQLPTGEQVEVGPGDDAAVVRLPSDRLVVTTDALVEGHDFLPGATLPRWIGRKAAVQNLADVAAMGARPLALVVALSAPAGTDPSVFEELSAGLAERAAADGAMIVGGDLGRADRLTLAVTAMGAMAPGDAPVLRSGARPGDVLTIGTVRLGRSAAGLALVLGGKVHVDAAGSISLEGITTPDAAGLVRHHDAPEVDLSLGWGA